MRALAAARAGRETWLVAAALAALGVGGLARWAGATAAADAVWTAVTGLGLVLATGWILADLRRRQPGVDLVALLALAGALAVGEPLAGAVIAVMLTGGRALEAAADRRARRELTALLDRAPRFATVVQGEQLLSSPVEEVHVGDLLLVRTGEVVPVDGLLESATAVLDESALTGEPMPVERATGDAVRSGAVNAGGPFRLRATTSAADSAYAGIVRLVREAQASAAPFVRLANRYAAVFVPVTLAVAAAAWLASGSAVRAVAVLVIATPCPLILAAPVAIVSGMDRTARRGVVVKNGGALERLARGRTLLFDKTGTLTVGRPSLVDVVTAPDAHADEVLHAAASLDQASPHVLASAVVRAARERGLPLAPPDHVVETHGQGISGMVGGRVVSVGKAPFVSPERPDWQRAARRRAAREGLITVFVALAGRPVGVLLFDDPIRPDAATAIRRLRAAGIARLVLVTGDRQDIAEGVGAALGLDGVLAECSPAEKVAAVRQEAEHAPTVMVGDGINDAPALAAATVGVAVAGAGATASSEAADVVLTVDRLDRVGEAMAIARRARSIALQSVLAGMGLSFAGMALAAAGFITPVFGAVAQEGIDVVVILAALRALRPGRAQAARLRRSDAEVARHFAAEHPPLLPQVDELRALADALDALPAEQVLARAASLHHFLAHTLQPHELAEEEQLYPAVARALGNADATAAMSREHREIGHQIRGLGALLDDLGGAPPEAADLVELRRRLYQLHAILRLHFSQEEEGYFTLADEHPPTRNAATP